MSSFHMTSGFATHGQLIQWSPLQSTYEQNLHCRRRFFKENSQEKRLVSFPSLSAQNNCLKQPFIPWDSYSIPWLVASLLQKLITCSVGRVQSWNPQAYWMVPAIVEQGNRASVNVEMSYTSV